MAPDDTSLPPRPRSGQPSSLLAAAMTGLERALFDRDPHELVEIVDHSGADHDPITLYLHPDIPEASLVLLRPDRADRRQHEHEHEHDG